MGVQGNFWSHIDRQLFPRLMALSEIAWTENEKKDWNEFNHRLGQLKQSLDILGINYFIEKLESGLKVPINVLTDLSFASNSQ